MIGLITGFLSSALPSAIDLWKDHSDKKQELSLYRLQMEHAEKSAVLEREASIQEADANLQAVTVKSAEKTVLKASQWVLNINAMVRPVITLMLIGAFIYATCKDPQLVGSGSALALASEWCISYWFGKRCFDKAKKQH